jgi:DNA-binding transcriptional LysR family regulator
VLVRHAKTLLDEAALAEADLAAAVGSVAGRGRIASFQSAARRIAVPAMARLARDAPELRCELIGAEPEEALPMLALGDIDLLIGDEWQHAPWTMPPGLDRHELLLDPVVLVMPTEHLTDRLRRSTVPLAEVADLPWVSGPPGLGWDEMVQRLCREHGRFTPQVRHRMNDAVVAAALVADGLGVALLPDLALPDDDPRITIRPIAGERPTRAIHAVTRTSDAARPSTRALLAAVRSVAEAVSRRPQRR